MSLRTITKIACLVISTGAMSFPFGACSQGAYVGGKPSYSENEPSPFEAPTTIARIAAAEVTESSGLAVSRCQEDVFWTHNDSGDGPFIYAFDSNGSSLGTWRVEEAKSIDWEDIATIRSEDGRCFLFIGEIGNNDKERDEHVIYKVEEPQISTDSKGRTRANALMTSKPEELRFQYPNGRNDAEALLVNPVTKNIYVITKPSSGAAEVFFLKPVFAIAEAQTARKLADISLPAKPIGKVTGGDISPDGSRVIICDYYSGYELEMNGSAADFDEIWAIKPMKFDLGPRVIGESISYGVDSNSVFATSEKPDAPRIRVIRKSQNKRPER